MSAKKSAERWEDTFGFAPHKVWVGERADKGGTLYLRWWDGTRGNWKWRSLGQGLRDEKGRVLDAVQQLARQAAKERYEELTGKGAPVVLTERTPLTLGRTWALISDEKTGLYPTDTAHRREVARELRHAVRILGPDTAWATIDKGRYLTLMRTRVDELRAAGHTALRGAEITMQRIHAIAVWLRDNEHIPADAAVPSSRWRLNLATYVEASHGGRLPEPAKPRHTLDEMRALLEKAWDTDPRFGLLMALGAEQRLGQVARCRRSDLNLEHKTLRIPGRGKKKAPIVLLTAGQVHAVERALQGYLARMERAHADYPLFPGVKLRHAIERVDGKYRRTGAAYMDPRTMANVAPVRGTGIRKWFRATEARCGIAHAAGRGAYGVRRVAVDAVKAAGISREGLKSHGGWASTQIPDAIYADQDAEYARREAMEKRAEIRGETVPATYPDPAITPEREVRVRSKRQSRKEMENGPERS